jgi:hypothetical protein
MAGVGLPLAEAVNETELPAHTDLFAGFKATAGATFNVTVALLDPEFAQFTSLIVVTL